MKILYSGGGTMGSVSPLIAIHQQLTTNDEQLTTSKVDAFWIGTITGVEKKIVQDAGIEFEAIASGKLRRYFDWQNLIDILNILVGFFQSLFWILKWQPNVIVTAGSFVAVPVVWAGWFCNVPIIVHQQDIQVGLANKLMQPCAKKITVALEKSLKDFPKDKVELVGNPVRHQETRDKKQETNKFQNLNFKFQNDLPVVLIMGGGTGASAINELVWESLDELIKFCNVIHVTGTNKQRNKETEKQNYKQFEFLNQDEIFDVMQNSGLVITRAGMSALTELAYFSKPTIIIPIPNSHQEKNAEYFAEKNAGIYVEQNLLTTDKFVKEIKQVLENKELQEKLGKNMHEIFVDYSGKKIIEIIKKYG